MAKILDGLDLWVYLEALPMVTKESDGNKNEPE
jgi:hypothetical protein